MSLKVLLDPIYSARPSNCSSAFKCRRLIEHTLAKRDDIFFYWMIPDWELDDIDKDWFPKHPNIRYIEFPYHKDRMREYLRYPDELDKIQAFNGDFWDFDFVFTSRTAQIPNTKLVMTAPRQKKQAKNPLKVVACFEEMIVMSSRPTVAKSDDLIQDMATINGYLASDVTYLQTEKEVKEIMTIARQYYSPATLKRLRSKFELVTPMPFREVCQKESKFRYDGKREFCLAYAGRMEKVSANLKDLYRVMGTQHAFGGESVKLLICTVTPSISFAPPSVTEYRVASREEFWRSAKEDMDVLLSLHYESEFSLTRFEPVMFGVPVVIIDRKWSRTLFGDHYPFYVQNMAEACAMITRIRADYDKYYDLFVEWQTTHFAPMFRPGGVFGTDMFARTFELMEQQEQNVLNVVRTDMKDRPALYALVDQIEDAAGGKPFVLFEILRKLGSEGKLDMLHQKTKDGDRDRRRLSFSTPWNEIRAVLLFRGWVDASTTVGSFMKPVQSIA
jgi:hypothetical protein